VNKVETNQAIEVPSAEGIVPRRLHHTARVVKDHEVTRRFYEDLIGMPLLATWTEVLTVPETGEAIPFCHTFYGVADGSAMAFFGFAKPEHYEQLRARTQNGFTHVALEVSREAQDALQLRLEAAGYEVSVTDHGYCRSIYTRDPDKLNLEFTSDPLNVAEINAQSAKVAHAELKRWMSGDLSVNTTLKPSA